MSKQLHGKNTDVFCTIGCSADTWPARDSNQVFWSYKTDRSSETDDHDACTACDYMNDYIMPVHFCKKDKHSDGIIAPVFELDNEMWQREVYYDEMSDEVDGEKCMWELLIKSHPHMEKRALEDEHVLQLLNSTRGKQSLGLDTFTAIFQPHDDGGSVQIHESYEILDKLPAGMIPSKLSLIHI